MAEKHNLSDLIDRANYIYDNIYDYSRFIYINYNTKGIIICSVHGPFEKNMANHISKRKQGCPKCSREKLTAEQSSKLKDVINKANKIHKNKYDYSKFIYINAKIESIIICPIHGEFNQCMDSHINQKCGCNDCGLIKRSDARRLKINDVIQKAHKVHNNKYTYDNFIYKNIDSESIITCKTHGDFSQIVWNHLDGHGCLKCRDEALSIRFMASSKDVFNKANIIHKNKYDYSQFNYNGAHKNSIIICNNHGPFNQCMANHLNGQGCPTCGYIISRKENIWLDSLNIQQNYRHKRIKINNRAFNLDGFDPNTNTIYEFYGDFWHGNPEMYELNEINPANKESFGELYQKTIERENILKSAGYKLITIWESDFDKLIKK